ncbi:hypothetical protein OPV22_003519 [Ensete ventricosum]|uniref:Uncharacterized protein n=1 Tax=Ensete ventricosum TaxID=4639 RepID=A0AAV8S189_ENSVE|nr:hypothetical protein OPV22_003519 [Ensete ventricosum]
MMHTMFSRNVLSCRSRIGLPRAFYGSLYEQSVMVKLDVRLVLNRSSSYHVRFVGIQVVHLLQGDQSPSLHSDFQRLITLEHHKQEASWSFSLAVLHLYQKVSGSCELSKVIDAMVETSQLVCDFEDQQKNISQPNRRLDMMWERLLGDLEQKTCMKG